MQHTCVLYPDLDREHMLFIVASFNAQSVKGNDMACKRCEISTFIKDNGVDLFL